MSSGSRQFFLFDSIPSATAYERVYALNASTPILITRASAWFQIAATGTAPVIQIRTLAGGLGSAITITLGSNKATGVGTGSITIAAGDSVYVRFIDCADLSDGGIDFETAQSFVPVSGVSIDEIISSVQIAIGRNIPRTMVNWAVRDARRWIQNKKDIRGAQKTATLSLIANQTDYPLATYIPDFKRPVDMYRLDSTNTLTGKFFIGLVHNPNEFDRMGTCATDTLPAGFNLWEDILRIRPVKTDTTVYFRYIRFLPDISGTQTDYLTTHYADTFLARTYYNIFKRLAKKDLAEYYRDLSLSEIKDSGQDDIHKETSGGSFDLEG